LEGWKEYEQDKKTTQARLRNQIHNWPTSSARDYKDSPGMDMGIHKGRDRSTNQLPRMVYSMEVSGLADQGNRNTSGSRQESWATPRAGKTTDENPETWAKRQAKGDVATMPLGTQVKDASNGKLNPRWVETLMGLPVGWVMPSCTSPVTIEPTNSDSSETESCQQPLNSPSELFGRN
jgi:hypothetical protein